MCRIFRNAYFFWSVACSDDADWPPYLISISIARTEHVHMHESRFFFTLPSSPAKPCVNPTDAAKIKEILTPISNRTLGDEHGYIIIHAAS